ncbi:MAG: DNA helicase RecQ [Pyrinomonadaceae bacterium]
MTIAHALDILKHQFGYDSFRMHQQAAIETVLAGRDCLVLMPTGGGKSLCYQVPAVMMGGVTVVVSPLIALMKDQTDALRSNGVEAAFLNSTQNAQEQTEVFRGVRQRRIKLLYVAPERLLQSGDRFLDFLASIDVSLFAIDEAHCISSWGHDFRPEYIQLGKLKQTFPNVPLIALTATADKLVRKDIVERLGIADAERFVSSFNRPNIFYRVEPKRNSYSQLLEYLDTRRDESGIIYCLSRSSVDSLAADLRDEGFDALAYHAGLDKATRDRHQELFVRDEAKIVVATIAFGMGIDKSNVRFVVHMDLPKNIESYYQETGRAGRDGLPSEALLFYSYADVIKLKGFAEVDGNREQTEIMLKKLAVMGEYGDLRTCRRRYLLKYFSEELAEDCGHCDNCTTEVERFDGTVIAQKALSAVYRTGGRFGISYLVDLLRGSQAKTIRDEHRNLPTYGVGADVSKNDWFDYFKDLIAQGYLKQNDGQFPTISLTETSADVLRGQVKIELIKSRNREEPKRRGTAVDSPLPEYDKELFDELRAVRTRFAHAENVPPYVILSDATLTEMAAYLPQSIEEMRRISGVGDLKLEKYGADFLREIVRYSEANALMSRIDLKSPKRERRQPSTASRRDRSGKDTYDTTLEMYRNGMSIADIAAARGLTRTTIENHLIRFIPSGEVPLDTFVSPDRYETIRDAIVRSGSTEALSPIKQLLGDDYSYTEIRAVLETLKSEPPA